MAEKSNKKEVYVLKWSNCDLKIIGPRNIQLEKKLTYTKNSLEMDTKTWSRNTTRQIVPIYNILSIDEETGLYKYQTFQGLLDLVKSLLEKQGHLVIIKDLRIPLVKPDLTNIGGFRGNQREKFLEMINANRSGILKAPTRWGKSCIISNICNAYPNSKIVILGPGVNLLPQLVEDLKKFLIIKRDIKGLFSGSKNRYESDDITVCSLDSMHKLNKESFEIVIIDEPHAAVTDSRAPHLCGFTKARIFATGATTEGRWSGNDILIKGLIGPVLTETTFKQAVDLGMLCPIKVFMTDFNLPFRGYKSRDTAYKNFIQNNEKFHKHIGELCNEVIPEDYQTLIFIDTEAEAESLQKYINNSVIAMDKRFKNNEERKQILQDLKDNKIKRCICSNIYSTGVTINDIRCVINCCAGAGNIMAVQKPGRLAEIKPNKAFGYMFDYNPKINIKPGEEKSWDARILKDASSRLAAYTARDFIVEFVDDHINLKGKLV